MSIIRRLTDRARREFAWITAAAVWFGALHPVELPMGVGVAALSFGLLGRRRWALVIVLVGVAAILSANARSGLRPPSLGEWSGALTLVDDPGIRMGATRVDADSDIGRVEVTAWGGVGRALAERAAGDRVRVDGRLTSLARPERAASRHVRAALTVSSLRRIGSEPWSVPLNRLRGIVLAGADPLPVELRPVYGGFVLGDDRGRSEEITHSFAAAGLTHLLVVSGENVGFVLLVLTPAVSRLSARRRTICVLLVLLAFAAMTRFEPSVLRATTMAAIATLAVVSGRRAGGRRVLGVAVTMLLLVDPLLVESTGFRLSVGASAGIILLSPVIERRLRGPHRLRVVLAVTISAQLAVAPLIVPTFGPMPLVAIPANVLTEPIAGLVMMWGCTGGIVAGLVGGPVAWLLQLPARLGLEWIVVVARTADALPNVDLGLPAIGALVAVAIVLHRAHASVRHRSIRSLLGSEGRR